MPTIARFDGISICMYADDPHLPHCHVRFAGDEIMVDLIELEIIAGKLPAATERKAMKWCAENRDILLRKWRELHKS
ncbi:DUF4160 domain-containing protein [bacterium]|nr:DUF4160 domain-containing protein [bacterium]